MLLKQSHVAESLHWYARDGSPAYEVEAVKGGKRPATLRDARKLGLVPSVTNIIRCAAAPGLETWKQQQVLLSALTLPRLADEPESDWLNRVMMDSREQGKKAAERGSAIHAAVQGRFEGIPPHEDHWPHVHGVEYKMNEHFGAQDWVCEKAFAHPMGFGGKVDIHCEGIVADFKTKEFSDDGKKLAWDEHCMQLAAYRVGLGMPIARCTNVFISVSNPGLVLIHEWTEVELMKGWEMFCGLLRYWQAKSWYMSAWQ